MRRGAAPEPCRLAGAALADYARLSSPGLAAAPTSAALARSAARCTDEGPGRLSVALEVGRPAAAGLRRLCRRGRYCARHPGSRALASYGGGGRSSSSSSSGGGGGGGAGLDTGGWWFAACVPVGCLGDDERLRALAWQILWRRLASLRGSEGVPAYQRDARVLVLRLFGHGGLWEGPELPLSEESLQDAGEDGPFDIVAVTDAPWRASSLLGSLPWPIRPRVLRQPEHIPWRFKFFDAERHLLSYVSYLRRRGYGDRLVIYADAFDTVWLGCKRNLTRALEILGRPIFFGAEFALHPAGLPGYPLGVKEHTSGGLPFCRQVQSLAGRWEAPPPDPHSPCLGVSYTDPIRGSGKVELDEAMAKFLNGGVYGGRAAALEVALRRLLGRQDLLRSENAKGETYRYNGRTHQYFWNQYLLDRPEDVTLDYGGAIVVNLAPRSLAQRQFAVDRKTGEVWSELFQRPVCIGHSNGGGFADSTFQLLHAARTLRFDTTAVAGVRAEALEKVSQGGLYVEREREDRITLDSGVCFGDLDPVRGWQGILSAVDLVTPHNHAAFEGLTFFVARPKARLEGAHRGGRPAVFEVRAVQHMPIVTMSGVPRIRRRNGTHWFEGRNRFDIVYFQLEVGRGDCIGWRCQGRCDLSYRELDAADAWPPGGGLPPGGHLGSWHGPGRDLAIGQSVTLEAWRPRSHAIGMLAEVTGVNFYAFNEDESAP